jgi:hypothetical protein
VGGVQGLRDRLVPVLPRQVTSFYVLSAGDGVELVLPPLFKGADAWPDLAQLLKDFLLSKGKGQINH